MQANDRFFSQAVDARERIRRGGSVVRLAVASVMGVMEVMGRAAAVPVGEEDGVGESRQISVRAALLPAAGGAGSHSDDGRQCLGLVLVDEVEALADQGPVVLERPRFLRTAK